MARNGMINTKGIGSNVAAPVIAPKHLAGQILMKLNTSIFCPDTFIAFPG